ncbi:MAG: hypothetical protein JWM99_2736, partial [Verrucomicrobiales bacterium]|nr:hypothetical protein [Verrucomicrobiales bacterium]
MLGHRMKKKGLSAGKNCLPVPETLYRWAITRLLGLIMLLQLGYASHVELVGANIATNSLVGSGTN